MIDECYYNNATNEIVVKAKATDAVAVLKQGETEKQIIELKSSADVINASTGVDAEVLAGEYTLEITADGNTYTKTVTIPEKETQEEATPSKFEDGLVALYTASDRNVKVIGTLTGRSADEPIIVMVAKAPKDGNEVSEDDIAYVEVFDGEEESFELNFTLPEGAYGDYVVRAGAMYAENAMENILADPEYAVACTFTASLENNTVSVSASIANYAAEDGKAAAIIITEYNNTGALEMITTENFTVNMNEGVKELTPVTKELDPDTVSCKIFLWDSASGLIPLANPIIIPEVK